ncbi:uncharacterized protein BXZ73DRAFT_79826 [Epithele typhae]|uniref:uncharacterized protein n=1 Tax=Epithele typhae TaxID=378194 RepID=UPI002008087C|nr:uncharacterized protein BXZ73DRAFT_79826 [Epithele typhae]KAH9921678.1 hypothetical protein BXZ73DRAFT_79826 [Epithele typhae]
MLHTASLTPAPLLPKRRDSDKPAASAPAAEKDLTLDETVEHAKRAFALKKYEQAVEHYTSALELVTKKHGEDLYFAYGKALLEYAISQAGVLGKQDPDEPVEDDKEGGRGGGRRRRGARGFEKRPDPSDELNLKLAEVFITLGDVSLETEKFEQAISDYEAGLALKDPLLPLSSRQIAEAHYKLSIVLDLTAGRLGDSIVHTERALDRRLGSRSCASRSAGRVSSSPRARVAGASGGKGKGKATGAPLEDNDAVSRMSKSQMEAEKELKGLREDLALKVKELKTSPNESAASAPELAAQASSAPGHLQQRRVGSKRRRTISPGS